MRIHIDFGRLFEVAPQYYSNPEAFTDEAVKSELLLALG